MHPVLAMEAALITRLNDLNAEVQRVLMREQARKEQNRKAYLKWCEKKKQEGSYSDYYKAYNDRAREKRKAKQAPAAEA